MWETILIAFVVVAAAAYLIRRTWVSASTGDCACDGGCDRCAVGAPQCGTLVCPPTAAEDTDDE